MYSIILQHLTWFQFSHTVLIIYSEWDINIEQVNGATPWLSEGHMLKWDMTQGLPQYDIPAPNQTAAKLLWQNPASS